MANENDGDFFASLPDEVRAEIESAGIEDDTGTPPAPAPEPQAAEDVPAPTPDAAPAPPAAAPAEPETAAEKAALRAARRGERRALAELERVRKENEALRAKVQPDPDPDQKVIEDFEADFADSPAVALLKKQREELQALKSAQAKPTEPAQAEFVPPVVDEELQEVLDGMPTLLAWQNEPTNRDRWNRLVEVDGFLNSSPKWRDKGYAERFAEAQRIVMDEFGDTASPKNPTPTPPPGARRQAIPEPQPGARPALSDFGGAPVAQNGEIEALPNEAAFDAAMHMDSDKLARLVGINH